MNTLSVLAALDFAARKHRDQRRKDPGASPYINHTIAVACSLESIGGVEDAEVLIAALLHDTLEDTETTAEEVEGLFGPVVRGLVEEVTDDKNLAKAERKRLQIEHAPSLSDGAALIKLGDLSANVRDVGQHAPPDWSVERRLEYLDWAQSVIEACPPVNEPLLVHFREVLGEARARLG